MADTDFYPNEVIAEKKRAFAAALMLSPLDPVKAARSIESRNTHVAYILNNWQYDAEVNQYMAEIRDSRGVEARIPSKEEFAATIYDDAQTLRDPEVKLTYYKLFADVMGYIEKGKGTVINNNNNSILNQQNVLVLPPVVEASDIENKLIEHQRQLTQNVNTG